MCQQLRYHLNKGDRRGARKHTCYRLNANPTWISESTSTGSLFSTRRGSRPLCGRHYPRIPASDRSRSFPGKLSGTAGNVWAGAPSRQGKPETFDFLGFTHICGKNGLGRFMVRRTTIRKRMRAKLREVKQQLRKRMHDPVPQTGGWLKSVVQGYFNYYAVPGNLKSLGVFRDRVIALWWRTIRRRSQKRRISWTRTLALAQRWLPQPRALHPFPDARFAATHPR